MYFFGFIFERHNCGTLIPLSPMGLKLLFNLNLLFSHLTESIHSLPVTSTVSYNCISFQWPPPCPKTSPLHRFLPLINFTYFACFLFLSQLDNILLVQKPVQFPDFLLRLLISSATYLSCKLFLLLIAFTLSLNTLLRIT